MIRSERLAPTTPETTANVVMIPSFAPWTSPAGSRARRLTAVCRRATSSHPGTLESPAGTPSERLAGLDAHERHQREKRDDSSPERRTPYPRLVEERQIHRSEHERDRHDDAPSRYRLRGADHADSMGDRTANTSASSAKARS